MVVHECVVTLPMHLADYSGSTRREHVQIGLFSGREFLSINVWDASYRC